MLETHPFGIFIPPMAKYLILGSFTAVKRENDYAYDWFYGSKFNQFWKILSEVYNSKLDTKIKKQMHLTKLSTAIGDIIYQCDRINGSSLDSKLTNIIFNTKSIADLLSEQKIETIYFTSRFVEKKFKKNFKNLIKLYPQTKLITLPSPSPRYASMRLNEKIEKYKQLLPKL